jgi:quercetin dioxygenase-like cupin family protein
MPARSPPFPAVRHSTLSPGELFVDHTRRDLAKLVPLLAAASVRAQDKRMLTSKVFVFEELAAKQNGRNSQRNTFDGATHTGFPIDLHLTELAPGEAPHGSHSHAHEEIVMVQRGTLEVTIKGKTTRVTPGSVVYVASGEVHGWRNTGSVPAQYFVLALGREGA